METRTMLIVIILATTSLCLFVIFAGCNMSHPEFDFNGDGAYSIPKQCEDFPDGQSYQSCIDRKLDKENMCTDWFSWLRY